MLDVIDNAIKLIYCPINVDAACYVSNLSYIIKMKNKLYTSVEFLRNLGFMINVTAILNVTHL
jgi:hypothetical protein